MSYRVVYLLVSLLVYFVCLWTLFEFVTEARWIIVPVLLVVMFFPKEWLAGRLSGRAPPQ